MGYVVFLLDKYIYQYMHQISILIVMCVQSSKTWLRKYHDRLVWPGLISFRTSLIEISAVLGQVYWRTLKTQHLDSNFNLSLKKEQKTIILIVF